MHRRPRRPTWRLTTLFLALLTSSAARAAESDWAIAGDGKTPTAHDWMQSWQLQLQTAKHQATVSHHGASTHGIDIQLPEIGRLRPSLGLAYNSQAAGDAEAPYGWSLSGVSEIRRPIGRAFATGEHVLDGALLVVDPTNPAQHRVRSASSRNTWAVHDAATDTWEVTEETGLVRRYAPADPGASGPDGTLRWRVVEEIDTTDNRTVYTYTADGRLDTVSWGANPSMGVGHLGKVSYQYVSRSHTRSDGHAGVQRRHAYVLSQVSVFLRDTDTAPFLPSNDLVLHLDDVDGRVTLGGFDRTGYDGAASDTLFGERYDYSDFTGSGGASLAALATTASATTQFSHRGVSDLFGKGWTRQDQTLVDWNGDGLLDILETTGVGAWTVRLQELTYTTDDWGHTLTFGGPTSVVGPLPTWMETETEFWSNTDFQTGVVGGEPRHIRTRTRLIDLDGDSFVDVVHSDDTTTWEVWYGTGGTTFDGPYTESAPGAWSGASYASDADLFPLETCATLYGLMDLDHDGWADWFDPTTGEVFRHVGVRGGGFDMGVNRYADLGPAGAPCWTEVDRLMAPDPVWSTFFPGGPDSFNERTRETAAFYDLDGDGLTDRVTSSGTPWQVELGRRNGGFDGPITWPAPMPFTSVVREGYPELSVPHPTGPGLYTFSGIDSAVLRGLFDVDADGDLDYVDAESGRWYPNVGDGFASGFEVLPGWWPSTLSTTTSASPTTVTMGPGFSKSESHSTTVSSMLDLDRDGVGDHVTDAWTAKGDSADRPHLLIRIDNALGGGSELSYRPASTALPSGDGLRYPGDTPLLTSGTMLVSDVRSTDLVTGVTAKTEHGYAHAKVVDGEFLGFHQRTQDAHLGGAWQSHHGEHFLFEHGLSPMLAATWTSTDANRNFAPRLARGPLLEKTIAQSFHDWTWATPLHRVEEQVIRFEFGEDPGPPRVTTLTYGYDAAGRPVGMHHDGGGDPLLEKDVGLTWVVGGNALTGQPLARIALVARSGHDPLTGGSRVLERNTYRYDGHASPFSVPTAGMVTAVETDAGWVAAGEALDASKLTTVYTRGGFGEITAATDLPTGETHSFGYAYHGSLPTQTTNGLGHTSHRFYDPYVRLLEEVDANGIGTWQTYDPLGRVRNAGTLDRFGNPTLTTRMTQASSPFWTTGVAQHTYAEDLDPSGAVETDRYVAVDGGGQEVHFWGRNATGTWVSTTAHFDARDNNTLTTHAIRPTGFVGVMAGAAGPAFEQRWFDAFGRVREERADVTGGTPSRTVAYPDPGLEVLTDPIGLRRRVHRDVHNRVIGVEEFVGDFTWVPTAQYEYDGLDQLVRYTDARGNTYQYAYDGVGRMRQSQGPDIGTTTFGFDGEHLVSRADSAGGSVAWTYDPIGRVDSMTVSDPLVGALHTTWAYDGSLPGLVDAASNAHSTSLFQYDDLGRAIHTDRIYADGTVLSSGATLDHRGRVTDEWTPGGAHVQATWGWGFKQQETVDGQVLSYAYDDAGNRVSASSSAGVDLHWTFGTTPRFPDSARMEAAGLTWSIHETHRGNDFLDSVQLLTPFAVLPPQTYGYDARGQLTEVVEAGAVVESFGYDLAGNLRTLREPSGTLWNYDLAGTGGTVGNQVGRRTDGTTVQTSTFDASGRTSTFDDGTIVEEYLYDGLGRLRAVRVGGVVIRELRRDHTDALIATLEGGATTYQFGSYRLNSATGDTSETLAGPLSKRNGARLWNLAGSDGEVRVSIDDAGVEQGTRMSSAYGQPAATTGTTWDQNAFHGMPMSGATMVAAGPRHLPLRDGTWLQPEPLLVSGQMGDLTQPLTFAMNRYSANAPTVMHDRSGMAPERRKSLKGVPPSVPEAEVTYPSGPPRGLPQMPDGTKITFRPVIDGVELRFDTDGNIAATLAKIKLSGPHAVNLRVRQAADGEYSTQVATPVGDFILAQDGSGRWDPGIRVPIAGGTIAVIAKNGFDGIEGNEALVISVYYGPVGVSKSVTREDMDQAASDAYDLFLDQCGPKCVMPEDLFWAYEDAFGHLPEPPSEY